MKHKLESRFLGEISIISYTQMTPQKVKKNYRDLGIYLPKETKDLYTENYKTPMKEIKEDTNRWRIYHVHGSEESI